MGLIYERRHTREIKELGGLSNVMPVYATLFMIVMLSSIGLPLLNGFIGEFTILQGAFEANWHWAAWAVVGIVLGAAYMLWLYQRTMFGACENPKNQVLKDLSFREIMTLVPLVVWAFWIGLYPKPFFKVLDKPVARHRRAGQSGLLPAFRSQAHRCLDRRWNSHFQLLRLRSRRQRKPRHRPECPRHPCPEEARR